LIWLELTDRPNFSLDYSQHYINNTIFFLTGNHLKYLLGFLNSRICEWYFDKIAATSGVGTRRWIKIYIDQICIPFPKKELEEKMNLLVDRMIETPVIDNRKEIENIFYNVFNFTEEEIKLIETAKL
jgi:adenine-specific DNA-methyltransferase